MRVLVAGASGAIGRQLLPLLDAVGHETIALVHRTPVEVDNGHVVSADALDRDALVTAVSEFEPEVVVNLLTAIPHNLNVRKFEQEFAKTNRLRTEGTANLVVATGGVRMISESIAFAYAPRPGRSPTRASRCGRTGPRHFAPPSQALKELERITAETGGVSLALRQPRRPGHQLRARRDDDHGGARRQAADRRRRIGHLLVRPHARCGDRDRRGAGAARGARGR